MVLKKHSFYRLILTGLLLAGAVSAESKWTHMRSENLEMYSETTTIRSQETLRALEQIHAFLIKSLGARDAALGATCVVAFKAQEDFAHFRPKVDTISFPVAGSDRDYVVLGLPEADAFEPAARAYAETLSRQLGLKLPVWLDEGLNSLYGSFTQRGNTVIAGELSPAQRKALIAETWGPLDQMLTAGSNIRSVRNQRLALAHMLLLNSDYAPKFKDLVTELRSGASSQAALEKVYAKPIADVEKDLKAYVASPLFAGIPISARSEISTITPAEPASSFDVNLALAGVINQPGRESATQAWLDRLAGMNPERPEPWAGLGYIAQRLGQSDIASKNFEKAISLGSRDPGVLWSHSRIARGDSTKDSEESLQKQLDKEPARVDLRLKLAALELDQKRPGLAYRLLEPVKDVPADLNARYLWELAYAQLETGEQSTARLTVARLEERSTTAAEKADAGRLKDFLAAPTRLTLGSATSAPSADAAPAQEKATQEKTVQAKADIQKAADARDKELAEAREKAAADAREKKEALAREKAEADQRQEEIVAARVKTEMEAKEKAASDAREKKEALAREKAGADQRQQEIVAARVKAELEAKEKAAADAHEKKEALAREKAEAGQRQQEIVAARVKAEVEAKEKAAADAREKKEALAREKAEADQRAQEIVAARVKAEVEAKEKASAEAREKVEARAREKAEADQRQQEIVAARVKAELDAKEKAAAEAQEKKEARSREKADREAKIKAVADAREKAATEARAREQAEAEARAKAAEEARKQDVQKEDARQKAEPTVLAQAAKQTKQTAEAYSATAPPQQASNIVPDTAGATAPVFPSMLSGSFVELGCGDQIKVVVQTEQGKKNFRIKNPANIIVSGKSGGTVDLNCGPQKPTNVRIQYGPGEGGFDGSVEAIYFE